MNILKIILILLQILSINSTTTSYPTCGKGKNNPKSEKQCTIYGTDSGFLCCYVKDLNGNAKCQLMSHKLAEILDIKGFKTVENGTYYSCGNSSNYLNLSIFILFLLKFIF